MSMIEKIYKNKWLTVLVNSLMTIKHDYLSDERNVLFFNEINMATIQSLPGPQQHPSLTNTSVFNIHNHFGYGFHVNFHQERSL